MKPFTDMTILIVDDDPASVNLIRKHLEEHGFNSIQTHTSPEAALTMAKSTLPDLIILDILMPEMTGYEFCNKLRTGTATAAIPIIMITGGAIDSDEAIKETFAAGATDFITKPIRTAELIARVQAVLRLKQTHDAMRDEIARRENAEKAVRESEQRFRAIASSTPDAIVLTDSDFRIIYWNAGAKKIFGYTEAEVLHKPVSMLMPQQYRDRDEQSSRRYLETGISPSLGTIVESKGIRKDGSEFHSEISTFHWQEEDQFFFGAIIRDIEQRKTIESELTRTNRFLEDVFATTGDGLIVTDKRGYIVKTNGKTADLLGYSREELLGMHMGELATQYYNYTQGESTPLMELFFEKGFIENCQIHYKTKEGKGLPLEVNLNMLKDGTGEMTGAVASIRDITERIKLEKNTRDTKNFLENIFNTTGDGLLITDSEGYIIQANKAFARMLGYTGQEIIGRHTGSFYPTEVDWDKIPPHIEKVFRDGYLKNHETKRSKKDGTTIDVEMNISLLKDSDGNIKGMVSAVRDITDRKVNEKNREKLIRELQEALAKVKTLSGLIPICASCKRIRDDKGYWNQIEAFIHEHSDAEFSHGICPECSRKLYPDLYEEE